MGTVVNQREVSKVTPNFWPVQLDRWTTTQWDREEDTAPAHVLPGARLRHRQMTQQAGAHLCNKELFSALNATFTPVRLLFTVPFPFQLMDLRSLLLHLTSSYHP